MKKSNKNLFWVSFADLMTSLFFVVLVLYVVTYVLLRKEQKELETKNENYFEISKELEKKNEEYIALADTLESQKEKLQVELEKLNQVLRLEQQFKPLQEDEDFIYLSECKKYISRKLSNIEIFEPNEAIIKSQFRSATIDVGRKLENLLKALNTTNKNFSYLVIIEGNMANTLDKKYSRDADHGYTKSYKRALAVYKLWKQYAIDLRDYNAEVLLCGSGFNGLCRDENEENNKRFSIQIIPKIEYSATN
jgi:TolA-binding protein